MASNSWCRSRHGNQLSRRASWGKPSSKPIPSASIFFTSGSGSRARLAFSPCGIPTSSAAMLHRWIIRATRITRLDIPNGAYQKPCSKSPGEGRAGKDFRPKFRAPALPFSWRHPDPEQNTRESASIGVKVQVVPQTGELSISLPLVRRIHRGIYRIDWGNYEIPVLCLS